LYRDRAGLLGSKMKSHDKSGHETKGNNFTIGAGSVTNGFAAVNEWRFLEYSGQSLNNDPLWSPNVESTLKYTLSNLAKEIRKTVKPSSPIDDNSLKLDADVRVQAFRDHTLRVKLDHISFSSNGSQIGLGRAHHILEDEISNQVGNGHTVQKFLNSLTTPFLIHTKRRMVKKVVVTKNEPSEVMEIKKLLASDLGKNGRKAKLQLVMKKAIVTPMETPRFPMMVDLEDYGTGAHKTRGGFRFGAETFANEMQGSDGFGSEGGASGIGGGNESTSGSSVRGMEWP